MHFLKAAARSSVNQREVVALRVVAPVSLGRVLDSLQNYLLVVNYTLISGKAGHFHMSIVEHVDLDTLTGHSYRDQNGVRAMPAQCIKEAAFVQIAKQFVQRMRHISSVTVSRSRQSRK
ncbi:hypothetical protein ACN9MG_10375 [Burkholderia ambifaria]|uniref:hypothetical protein n=1 Tax=Burkholderia ambifaria TaxID=152480 RepID=UPI003CEF37BF